MEESTPELVQVVLVTIDIMWEWLPVKCLSDCDNTVFALIYGTAKNSCTGDRSVLIRMC